MPHNNPNQPQSTAVYSPSGGQQMQYTYRVVTAVPMPTGGAPPMMPVPSNGLMAAYLPSSTANNSFSAVQKSPYASRERTSPQAVERVGSKEERSNAHSPKKDDDKSHRSMTSWEDKREIAASVLLLAAGGHDKVLQQQAGMKRDTDSTDSSDSKVPLKKRKMLTEVTKDDNASVRVSPVSHGSRSMRTLSPEHTHSTSYDSKHTPERSLPSQVVVIHFPTELYRLLEEDDTKVIQWLGHGRAWRIVRWDALRKQILPRSFGGTSVDGFLAQLADWGFTEVTDGPDAGAYYNPFFRRGFPHLCKDMQYKPRSNTTPVKSPPNTTNSSPINKHENTPHTHVSNHSANSTGTPSILQVPSLASPHDTNGSGSPTSPPTTKRLSTNMPPRGSPQSVGTYVSATGRPNMPFWFVDANQQAVLVHYRPSHEETARPPYPPVRVRSSRGRPSSGPVRRSPIVTPVRRMDESSANSTASGSSMHKRRYPISQRGRSRAVSRPATFVSSTSSAMSSGSHHTAAHGNVVVDKPQEV